MLRNKYRAFEIKDNQVSQTLVDGNLCSIAEFIRHCSEGRERSVSRAVPRSME